MYLENKVESTVVVKLFNKFSTNLPVIDNLLTKFGNKYLNYAHIRYLVN
jgi:hypothetical protein